MLRELCPTDDKNGLVRMGLVRGKFGDEHFVFMIDAEDGKDFNLAKVREVWILIGGELAMVM